MQNVEQPWRQSSSTSRPAQSALRLGASASAAGARSSVSNWRIFSSSSCKSSLSLGLGEIISLQGRSS